MRYTHAFILKKIIVHVEKKIALFEKANKKYNIDKTKSYMIGDRYSDIRIIIAFNVKTILGDGYRRE